MPTNISKYKIEGLVGEGGMGKVYLGVDIESGKKAAIKELHKLYSYDKHLRMRFQREALAMSNLDHPNIVKFYELVEANGGIYLIMEYAEGITLEEFITQRTEVLSEDEVIKLISKIINALSYAHDRKIVHRDIKPGNIIVSDSLDVKILDFGIAKILDSTDIGLTSIGAILGSNCYMSPEQVQGLSIDTRTDIYSLGILLFFMLTGRPPFNSSILSDYDIQVKITREPIPRAIEVNKLVSIKMQEILDKATNKDMTQRFQTCREFLKALYEVKAHDELGNMYESKTIILGRDPNCDLTFKDPNVSRKHAEIYIYQKQYYIRDISTNGTKVRGQKIFHQEVPIKPGDKILLAGLTPLNWYDVQKLLPFPIDSAEPNQSEVDIDPTFTTVVDPDEAQKEVDNQEQLELGLGILSFIIPGVGWIFYLKLRQKSPVKAHKARKLGVIGTTILLLVLLIFFSS